MSKTILIDASNSEQTRIAVTVNDKLDDFEIESNKKNYYNFQNLNHFYKSRLWNRLKYDNREELTI